jgi:hypothetical protein
LDHSPLLRLPAELRNTIYEYVIGGYNIFLTIFFDTWLHGSLPYPTGRCSAIIRWGKPYTQLSPEDGSPIDQSRPLRPFALLKACRQTYDEAWMLPFSLNVISFRDLTSLHVWESQHESQIAAVRTILLHSANGWPPHRTIEGEHGVINSLEVFKGLQRVEVNVTLQGPQTFASSTVNTTVWLTAIMAREKNMELNIRRVCPGVSDVTFSHFGFSGYLAYAKAFFNKQALKQENDAKDQ